MIQILFFKKLENITSKYILFQKYILFSLLLSNEKSDNKQGLSLVFIERVLFLNNSLNNLIKNLRENFFHYLN